MSRKEVIKEVITRRTKKEGFSKANKKRVRTVARAEGVEIRLPQKYSEEKIEIKKKQPKHSRTKRNLSFAFLQKEKHKKEQVSQELDTETFEDYIQTKEPIKTR